LLLVLELAIIWEYVVTTKLLVSARKFERLCNFFKSQASYIPQLVSASGATVVHSQLAA
jgi:hypothetical protein